MNELFLVSVPEFQEDGELRIVLEVCLASMLRHYQSIREKCGGHCRFISDLVNGAMAVKLRDDQYPELTPDLVLLEWSKKIQIHFNNESRKERIKAMDPEGTNGNSLLVEMSENISKLTENNNNILLEVATQKSTIIDLEKTIKKQSDEIQMLRAKLKKEKQKEKQMVKKMREILPPNTPESNLKSPSSPESNLKSPSSHKRSNEGELTSGFAAPNKRFEQS